MRGRHRFGILCRHGMALIVLGLLLTGCLTEPFTGRRQFIMTPESTEISMSLDAWRQILEEETLSTNKTMNEAVQRVGNAISAVADKPDYQWEFRVIASDQANAFCLPGGKVGIYEGLFKYLANDGELATVVGHEVGHAVARHGGERMTQAMMVSVGALGLAFATKDQATVSRERWLMAYGGISTVGFILPYSRTHEYAADEIGLMLMAKAGYDPEAAVSFWQKFSADKGSAMPDFLSTHPMGEKRMQQLRQIAHKAHLEYEMSPTRRGLGKSY